MKPSSLLLAFFILFSHFGASANVYNGPAVSPFITTSFTVQLNVDNYFARPVRPGEFDTEIDYTTQLTVSDLYIEPTFTFNYAMQDIYPQQTGAYDITVISAAMINTEPGFEGDTFIFLYENEFNPASPLQNLVRANDDKSGSDYTSVLLNVALDAGKKYTIVMTSYEQGVTGSANFDVTGPASVNLVLPIKWLSMQAVPQKNRIDVIWKTAEEINTAYYEIERSEEGQSFTSIAKIPSNGEVKNIYSYADTYHLRNGINYLYRIRLIDLDGSISYSITATAKLTGISADRIVVKNNPFKNRIDLLLYSGNTTEAVVELIGINGGKILSKKVLLLPGANPLSLQTGNLPKGSYVLQLVKNNEPGLRTQLIKQ